MFGKMVENIKAIILMTKNMAMENIHGLMERYLVDNGSKVNVKGKVNYLTKMVNVSKDFGKMIKDYSGLEKNLKKTLIFRMK